MYSTLARVEIQGMVDWYNNYTGDLVRSVGPRGWSIGAPCRLKSAVAYQGGVYSYSGCAGDHNQTDTVTFVMELFGWSYALISKVPYTTCGPENIPCNRYAGSRTVTVTIPRPIVELTASDTFVVASVGKSIAFTAAVVPSSMWGRTIPKRVLRWRWAPDSGTGTTISCAMTCTRTLNQPGTMYVDIRINDRVVTGSVRIHAEELSLEGVPDTVYPGENIHYTASTRFGTPISNGSWQWNGAPPTKGTALTSAQCVPGSATCTVETFETGEMVFTGTVAGVQMSAADSAFVVPCPPTGDPVLDDPEVVKGLYNALASGNPNAPVGVTGPGARQEKVLAGYRRSDGSQYLQDATAPYSTQCFAAIDPNYTPTGDSYEFLGHVHVSRPGNALLLIPPDVVYGCPEKDAVGNFIWSQVPGDGLPLRYKGALGGSAADADVVRGQGLPVYLIEADSSIFKLGHPNPFLGPDNPTKMRPTRGVCVQLPPPINP